jgi:O-methyltransferase
MQTGMSNNSINQQIKNKFRRMQSIVKNSVHGFFKIFGFTIKKYEAEDTDKRRNTIQYMNLYNKYKEFTMIPLKQFVENLEVADKFKDLQGSVVECGVWRGGMSAAISELCGTSREYYLFDSFEGLPPANENDGKDAIDWQKNKDSKYYYDNCKAEIQYARTAMSMAGVKDAKLTQGWFNETLHTVDPGKIAILRLDADWYDSTMTCLTEYYPKVVSGGLILIDDYNFWEGCSKAVHDYLSKNNLSDRIHQTANGVAYIIKDEVIKRAW